MSKGVEFVEVLKVPADYLMKCGLGSPVSRFVCLSALTAAGGYLLKMPRESFRRDGSSKPLNLITPGGDAVGPASHFLTVPLLGSLLFVAVLT